MTSANRFIFRLLRIYPIAFIALAAVTNVTDSKTGGQMMFLSLVAMPVILLASAFLGRLAGPVSVSRSGEPPKRYGSAVNSCLLFGGMYGIFGVIALIVFAGVSGARPTFMEFAVFFAVMLAVPVGSTAALFLLPLLRGQHGYIRAMKLARKGRYSEGCAAFAKNCANRPRDATAWQGAAYGHLLLHETWRALEDANHAVCLRADADTLFMRGQALLGLGATQEAFADLMESSRLKDGPFLDVIIGTGLTRQRKLAQAIYHLEAAQSANAATGVYLADAYRLAGFDRDARNTYRNAAAAAEMCGRTGRGFAAYGYALGDKADKAWKLAARALESNPRDTMALSALLHLNRHNPDAALFIAGAFAMLTANGAVDALSDPELCPLFEDRRLREMFVAAVRVRDDQIARARRLVADPAEESA